MDTSNQLKIYLSCSKSEFPPFDEDANDTIEKLKDDIHLYAGHGAPVQKQLLSYEGKLLDDEKTFKDYALSNEVTIHLDISRD